MSGRTGWARRDVALALTYPVALGVVGDRPGLLIGVLAVVAVGLVGPPFGFAVAQVGLLPIAAGTAGVVVVGLEVLFVLVVLVGLRWRSTISRGALAKRAAGLLGLLAIGVAAIHGGPWEDSVLAGGLVGGFALLVYGTHRYELVALGRVEEDRR